MKIKIGYKLLLLFCIMTMLFVGFALYVEYDLKNYETGLKQNRNSAELLADIESSEKIIVTVLISGTFMGLGIMYYLRMLTLSIARPLDSLVKAANEIADGDLSAEIKGIRLDNEVGELAEDFNKMVKSLRT